MERVVLLAMNSILLWIEESILRDAFNQYGTET